VKDWQAVDAMQSASVLQRGAGRAAALTAAVCSSKPDCERSQLDDIQTNSKDIGSLTQARARFICRSFLLTVGKTEWDADVDTWGGRCSFGAHVAALAFGRP
jgi:hypothetical protein